MDNRVGTQARAAICRLAPLTVFSPPRAPRVPTRLHPKRWAEDPAWTCLPV